MKRNSLLLIFLLVLLTCCKSEDAPIKAIKPNEPGSINEEYMSRAETTLCQYLQILLERTGWIDVRYLPQHAGYARRAQQPRLQQPRLSVGVWAAYSRASTPLCKNTDNVDFRTTYESQLKRTLLEYYNTTKEPMCFGCFVNDHDERLYDDAIWVGIDLTDL